MIPLKQKLHFYRATQMFFYNDCVIESLFYFALSTSQRKREAKRTFFELAVLSREGSGECTDHSSV